MPPSTAAENAFEAEDEAHLVMRNAVVRADHDPGHRAESGADHERQRDHRVDVDAHQSGDLLVLRRRAHRDAELRPVHEREQATPSSAPT